MATLFWFIFGSHCNELPTQECLDIVPVLIFSSPKRVGRDGRKDARCPVSLLIFVMLAPVSACISAAANLRLHHSRLAWTPVK